MSTKYFLRDTQTEPGTTGTPSSLGSTVDLSLTQGTAATLGSGGTTSDTYVVAKIFTVTPTFVVHTTSFSVSIDMASVSSSNLLWVFRLRRVNSSGGVEEDGANSSEYNTSGVKTATMSLSGTWNSGDRLQILFALRRNGGVGSRSFTLNVQSASGYVSFAAYPLPLASGSYTLTGSTLGLGAGLPLAAGSYALTGAALTLRRALSKVLDAGSYVVTGSTVTLGRGYLLSLAAGSYVLTGSALVGARGGLLGSGSYSLAGADVALLLGKGLPLGAGTYAITGAALQMLLAWYLTLGGGAYTITGQNVGLLGPSGGPAPPAPGLMNNVTITTDTGVLRLRGRPLLAADPTMEFLSGSFKGSPDERRVAFVVAAIPDGSKVFSLRFEFTDPALAGSDIYGTPMYSTDEDRVKPYQDIANLTADATDRHVS